MIVPMTKYDFVLYAGQKDDFLAKLQDLGLVDITTTGWEPDDGERDLMISIDKHRTAVSRLRELAATKGFKPGKPYTSGEEAFNEYIKSSTQEDALTAEIAQANKELEELRVWGDFDVEAIGELEKNDVVLRYFSDNAKDFRSHFESWSEQYDIVPINDYEGNTYFVVITSPGEEVSLNALEIKQPTGDHREKEARIAELEKEKAVWSEELRRAAASIDLIEEHGSLEQEQLHLSQAANSGQEEVEGKLIIMEGWATEETVAKVDSMLEDYPNLFYITSKPTPEDNPPTLLKNNRFNRIFEFIGNFYSLPRYGTMDLTPFFGPFYVLFFGLCLADAGYGLIFLIAGLFMLKKGKPAVKGISRLIILCGIMTMICGAFMGSFFGIPFHEFEPFAAFSRFVLNEDNLFILALAIGVVQIMFGMILKMVKLTHMYGFKYALSTLGWFIVVVALVLAWGLGAVGIEQDWFTPGSPQFFATIGVGAFMMLFLNSPGKNPLVNFGAGLWNTYNDVTGILGDVLSYIRLFAIGLSGGILASVFNQLALGLSPDIPVVRQLSILIILLIGHGITLFMSSLSAFVHPMRLTFVEFYKNADFETTERVFTPLKHIEKE